MGKHDTLQVDGEQHINVYRSKLNDRGAYEADGLGFSRRHFCKQCGTMLWNYNPRYGSWFYPFASAIDTPLPVPPERAEIMLDYKPSWCEVPEGPNEKHFARYPDEGIEDWHKKRGLYRD
jgi:hypothetical protein